LEKQELKAFLAQALDLISEQEKLVLALYYYEELTLKEIGEVMNISESRVSQIHTKAIMNETAGDDKGEIRILKLWRIRTLLVP
jgi:RNA polymerase sigma factor for flagellar operon FliA